MPKQVLHIPSFDKGTYGNIDRRDVPEGYAAFTQNVDGSITGKVRGINQSTEVSTSYDPRIMIAKRFGTPEIIGQDASKQVKTFRLSDSNESDIGSTTTNFISSMVAQGKEVYCGTTTSFKGETPGSQLWIGRIKHEQFNNGFSEQRVVDATGITSYEDVQLTGTATNPYIAFDSFGDYSDMVQFDSTGTVFTQDKKYFWAVSLVYDGYQESGLVRGQFAGDGTLSYFGQSPSGDFNNAHLAFRVAFEDYGDLSRRVTSFNLYRAEASDANASIPESEYRFVRNWDINLTASDGRYDSGIASTLSGALNDVDTTFFVGDADPYEPQDSIQIESEEMTVTSVDYGTNELTVNRSSPVAHGGGEVVKIGYDWWLISDSSNFPSGLTGSPKYFTLRFLDDGDQGATYEDRTGRPDTLEVTSVDYKLSTDYNSQLFVAVCDVPDVFEDASQFIFRSTPNQYGLFNTAEDFVQLPEVPTALAGFGGRLYAFSESNTYRINPQGLYVEDTFAGVGSLNEDCVVVTNFGMFHADENNIYLNNGSQSTPIGDPILRVLAKSGSDFGWLEMDKTVSGQDIYARLAFDPQTRRLLVFGSSSGATTVCWAYDLTYQRWDLYTSLDMPLAATNIPDGTLYITHDDGGGGLDLSSLFTSSSRHNWELLTASFSPGSGTAPKYFYQISAHGGGNFDIKYEIDDDGNTIDPGTGDNGNLRTAHVTDQDKKAESIAITIASISATDELDNVSIIFRPQQLAG